MENPKMSHVKVEGHEYGLVWHDFGTYFRLTIYIDGKVWAKRNLPPRVDTGMGTIRYIVKSILEGAKHGMQKAETRAETFHRVGKELRLNAILRSLWGRG
jgi:hypothetical protein